jgi:hypothetical protein
MATLLEPIFFFTCLHNSDLESFPIDSPVAAYEMRQDTSFSSIDTAEVSEDHKSETYSCNSTKNGIDE